MKKHVIWSIYCMDCDMNKAVCLLEFDEDTSIMEVTTACLVLENVGVNDPSIHVKVYYTEENK